MRLAVLDVGSNTVHLLVVDAHLGAHPWPAHSVKAVLRLAEQIGKDGRLSKSGADSLVTSVLEARDAAAKLETEDLLAFATSAVRDAKNSAEVLARVRKETGVELRVLSGEGEARMTFLAVRRWYGWSAGNLLVLDIGGGSLEIGVGIDEEPVQALSLSLGAGRMTRQFLNGDPPRARDIDALTEFAEDALDQALKPSTSPAGTRPSQRRRPSVRLPAWPDPRRRRPDHGRLANSPGPACISCSGSSAISRAMRSRKWTAWTRAEPSSCWPAESWRRWR